MELTSKYETVFIVNPDFTEEASKGFLEKFTGLITENGGMVDKVDEWGKKKLAYLIDDYSDGYYYVVNFTAKADVPAELRQCVQHHRRCSPFHHCKARQVIRAEEVCVAWQVSTRLF